MANGDGDSAGLEARDLACWVLAGALVIIAVRSSTSAVTVAAMILAVVMTALPLLAPHLGRLSSAWLKGAGFDIGMQLEQERQASADAATETEVGPAELAEELGTDDTGPPSPSPDDAKVIGVLSYILGSISLEAVFDFGRVGPLDNCDFRLYLYDGADGLLKTVPPNDNTAWAPGRGAVGEAYRDGQVVAVVGDAVHDGTYGLSPEEQRRFSDLQGVIATPVYNAVGSVIGVVSAATKDPNHQVGTPDAEETMTLVALLCSRVLVDVFKWFDDDSRP